jgi:hypothetical protein
MSMFQRSVLFSLLSAAAFASVCACSSNSGSSPVNGTDSGVKSDSSLGGQDSAPPVDTGSTDSTVADTNVTNDSGVTATDSGTGTDSGTAGDTGTTSGDSGTATDSGAATDGSAGDSAIPVIPPTGTPIATGDNLQVWGITGDDFVVYSDETAGILYAIPVAGGTPKTIMSSLGSSIPVDGGAATHFVGVSQNVVVIWTGLDANGVGPMSLWTSAAASADMVSANTLSGFGLVTADSSHVAYFDNVNENIGVGDFVEVTATGTGKTTLVPTVDLTGASCNVTGGTGGSTVFVLNHCQQLPADAGADAATPSTFLSEFAVANGHRTDLLSTTVTDTSTFVINTAGTELLVIGDPGLEAFSLAALDSGAPTPKLIDANAVGSVLFTPDGLSTIYETGTPSMLRSLIATPNPTTLQATFLGIYGISPDGTHVLGLENVDPTGNTSNTDLFLASATTNAAAKSLVPGTTALSVGDVFTTDSSHALYEDQSGAVPTLNSYAVNGAAPTVLAQNPQLVLGTGTSSSVVLFTNNPFASLTLSNGAGTADIYTVDTAMAAAPTLLVSQANAGFGLTSGRDKIAYAWNVQAGPKAGLYVATLP